MLSSNFLLTKKQRPLKKNLISIDLSIGNYKILFYNVYSLDEK